MCRFFSACVWVASSAVKGPSCDAFCLLPSSEDNVPLSVNWTAMDRLLPSEPPRHLKGKLPKLGLPALQWAFFLFSPGHGSLSTSLLAGGGISCLPISSVFWPPPPLWVSYLLGDIPFSPRLFLQAPFALIHLVSHYQKIILCIKTVSLQIPVWFLTLDRTLTHGSELRWLRWMKGKGLGPDQVLGWFYQGIFAHRSLVPTMQLQSQQNLITRQFFQAE